MDEEWASRHERERRGGEAETGKSSPGLKQSLSARRRETGGDGVELPGGREGRQTKRGETSSENRTGGDGAIEQEESMHAATGSSKESSQVFAGACADVREPCASSHLFH